MMTDRPGPAPASKADDEPPPRTSGGDLGATAQSGVPPQAADERSDSALVRAGVDGESTDEDDEAPPRKRSRSFLGELPFLVLLALLLVMLLKAFVVQAFYIPSRSMEPTLAVGDRILVNEMVYRFRDVRRGEVVVFDGVDSWVSDPGLVGGEPSRNPIRRVAAAVGSTLGLVPPNDKIYIKRVVGVPGDRVVCCDSSNRITVNGAPLEEKDYLFPDDRPSDRPFDVTVPAGRIFVLGDHRAMSADSREHLEVANGTVAIDKVVGRAFVVIWPLGNWSGMGRPPTYEQERLSGSPPAAPHGRRT